MRWSRRVYLGSISYAPDCLHSAVGVKASEAPHGPELAVRFGLDGCAHLIKDTMSAHLHQESDPGPFLPIERQVDEGRNAYEVEARRRDITAGDSDRLDGLVD